MIVMNFSSKLTIKDDKQRLLFQEEKLIHFLDDSSVILTESFEISVDFKLKKYIIKITRE